MHEYLGVKFKYNEIFDWNVAPLAKGAGRTLRKIISTEH